MFTRTLSRTALVTPQLGACTSLKLLLATQLRSFASGKEKAKKRTASLRLEETKLYKRWVTSDEPNESDEEEYSGATPEQTAAQEHYKTQVFNWDPYVFRHPAPEGVKERMKIEPTNTVYTEIDRALDHGQDDIGKYYEIPPEMVERLHITRFQSQRKAEQPLRWEWNFTSEYLMVRKEGYELAQRIKGSFGLGGAKLLDTITTTPEEEKAFREQVIAGLIATTEEEDLMPSEDEDDASVNEPTSLKGKRFCIYGRKGTGKTAVMNYLGQIGMEAGMIVLPTQGLEYPNDHLGFILRNDESGLFDQPRFAQDWFKYMLAVNPHSLARVGLKGDYSETDWHWDPEIEYDERTERKKDVGFVYRTLADLADLGSRNPEFAAELMYKFVEEIYAIDSTEPGVLILVDDINWWEGPSEYYDPKTVLPLKAKKMAMVDHFNRFVDEPPSNSTVIYSLATAGYMRYSPKYRDMAEDFVEIPKYTHDEFLSALMHYQICNVPELERHDFNLKWINYTKALSGMVPHEVLKVMTIL